MSRKLDVKTVYTDEGVDIVKTYHFSWDEFVVEHFPENCGQCPVGFMMCGCGRRVPLDFDCRPDTCKLRTLEAVLNGGDGK